MEWLIANGGIESVPLYNCSALTSAEWSLQHGVKKPIWGSLDLAYGIIIEILYIPCLIVIASKEYFAHSCFKIMFFLGIVDMAAIGVNSIITGWLLVEGAVFCTYPNFIFISGSFGLGLWCTACLICLLLVVNRLMDMLEYSKTYSDYIFHGWRTYFILLLCFIYGGYFFFFTPPVVFASKYVAWFFDPFIFPDRSLEYQNPLHSANNLFLVGFTCVLYGVFCVAVGRRLRQTFTESTGQRKLHNQIFIQSTLICLVNFFASVIYVVMQFIPVPDFFIALGHMGWQFGHGCPAVIYLVMNRTIRNGVLRLLRLKAAKSRRITGTGGSHGHHSDTTKPL
ncbi:unnamed protein product [Auanema sp. JU1783]|nr:unnamed protein product [Auanema sp. JU1783]